ncbi:NUDIX domain-containing protein [Verrucomicrobium sp. BvORR034]|uniref:NUDIX domain-containing protein n=1 Tax=Verrucomicrobium sp. BvORR034 TaxID=1396418 RepID=UPI000678B9D0|nr:NUDIX domain-containing protein [Verrucomicrobium sp. BvORR034]
MSETTASPAPAAAVASVEHVLVIPRALFDELGAFQGFQPEVDRYLEAILAPGANFFLPRPAAELDPTHKQIIPYAIFHHQGKYLVYTRGGKSGEKRLVAKRSVGIGGHINPHDEREDSLAKTTYLNGVEREIEEELVLTGSHTQQVIGLINDDSNEVGQVHLGVVHLFDLESDQVTSNEDAIQDLQFLSLDELVAGIENLETWSAICVRHLVERRA